MTMVLGNIKEYTKALKEEFKERIAVIGDAPKLAIIQIGNVEASNRYIKNKIKDCEEVGIIAHRYWFDTEITEPELMQEIQELKTMLNLKNTHSEYELEHAKVISRNNQFWLNTFTIDKGENAGVTKESAVITINGLIGKITKVTKNHSEALSCFACCFKACEEGGNENGMGVHHNLYVELRMPPILALLQILAADLTDALTDLTVTEGHEVGGHKVEDGSGLENDVFHSFISPFSITELIFIR